MKKGKRILAFLLAAVMLMMLSVTAFADNTPAGDGIDFDNSAYYNVDWEQVKIESHYGWSCPIRGKWNTAFVWRYKGEDVKPGEPYNNEGFTSTKPFCEYVMGNNKNALVWYGWVEEWGIWDGRLYGVPIVRNSVTGQKVPVTRWEVTVIQKGLCHNCTLDYLGEWTTSGEGSVIDTRSRSDSALRTEVRGEVVDTTVKTPTRGLSVRLYLADGNSILLSNTSEINGEINPDAATAHGGRGTATPRKRATYNGHYMYSDELKTGNNGYSMVYLTQPNNVKDYHFVIEKTVTGAADNASYTFPVRVSINGGPEMTVKVKTTGNGTFRKEVTFRAYEGDYTVSAREVLSDMPKGAQIVTGSDSGKVVLTSEAITDASTLSLKNFVDDPNPQHLEPGQTIGSVTVLNTTHGHTYEGYKIFDAHVNPVNVDAIIYTIREDSPWYEFVQDYFTLTELEKDDDGTQVYKAEAKEGFDPKTFFENLPTVGIEPDLPEISDHRDGIIKWENVPFGYYAITSTLGSWVTVNTNNPNVIVIDKNQTAVIDKNIVTADGKTKTNSASFGESVGFDIDLLASDFKANELVTYYHIKDTISDGFDYDFSDGKNVTVKVNGTQNGTNGEDPYEFTLSPVSSPEALQAAKSGYYFSHTAGSRSFEIIVKWATLNEAGKLMPVYEDEFNHLHVTYSATVNDSAVIAGSGNPNTASFTYDKTSGFDPEYPPLEEPPVGTNPEDPNTPVSTTTYVYALGIEKVDAVDNTVHLPGVKFTTADFYAKKLSEGVYEVIPVEVGDTGEIMTEYAEYFEVPESGFILIKGLGAGEYSFYESETLPGYNLLAEPLVITIPASGETVDTLSDTPCAALSTVENGTGVELPETGGIGTTVFFVCGSALVLAAGLLLVSKKRMVQGER